jgi:hypothetical protein
MAESGQQSTLDSQRKNFTYDQAKSAWESGSGSGGGGGDYASIIANAIKMQQEANKPAVQSLEASIPEIQASYAQQGKQLTAEKAPLEARYQSLLDSIVGQKTQSVNKQTVATSTELGKRGVPMSSGLSQQELINTTEPINQYYTGQYKDTSFARESALRTLQNQIDALPNQQSAEVRAVRNAIAQLQSGASQAGISTGLSLYQQQQAQKQQDVVNQLAQSAESRASQLFPYELTAKQLANQKATQSLSSGGSGNIETYLGKSAADEMPYLQLQANLGNYQSNSTNKSRPSLQSFYQ